ncbi:MAG: DNA-directed RNA polymerase subunit K [Desulfurococcales archaeon]|nr:DNA-directed RNA polymerase subunit K [Desulfurococcales archaeon]
MSEGEGGDFYSVYPRVAEEIRIGPPMLTKYERAKLIGARALQIYHGAPPLVDIEVVGSLDPIDIARYEVDNGILPVTIYRYQKGTGRGQAIPLKVLLEVERRVVGGRVYR